MDPAKVPATGCNVMRHRVPDCVCLVALRSSTSAIPSQVIRRAALIVHAVSWCAVDPARSARVFSDLVLSALRKIVGKRQVIGLQCDVVILGLAVTTD